MQYRRVYWKANSAFIDILCLFSTIRSQSFYGVNFFDTCEANSANRACKTHEMALARPWADREIPFEGAGMRGPPFELLRLRCTTKLASNAAGGHVPSVFTGIFLPVPAQFDRALAPAGRVRLPSNAALKAACEGETGCPPVHREAIRLKNVQDHIRYLTTHSKHKIERNGA
jgi:hypothetical protein